MARKIKAKLILSLRASGCSRNEIAQTYGMAKKSVIEVFDAADELGIGWDDVKDLDDDEVYRIIFPDRYSTPSIYEQPDWESVHKELGRVGVTLQILHAEYVAECGRTGKVHMGYTKFCEGYRSFTVSKDIASRVLRKAGGSVEVDWSGPTIPLVNPETGEVSKVYLFVATLPFSRYSYVEPTFDMRQDTWLVCHVNMFEFFGGSVPRIVCDNLRTGVVKHPREGEVVLNDAYRELAAHYGSAVIPARVGKPKDKPSAEGTVGNIATAIIAPLRNETFFSFDALKLAVAERLDAYNARAFQKRDGSRKLVFDEEEKASLRPLPPAPYEVCEWVYGRKVAKNCHVSYKKNHYSCSYRYIGETVDLRVTSKLLEIYHGDSRIATHVLLPSYATGRYSTREGDIPQEKVWREWDAERIRRWADRIGPATAGCVNRIFESVRYDEQGFDAALALLRLSRKYGSDRLEAASEIALRSVYSPRYKHVKPILESNQDKLEAARANDNEDSDEQGGYVRGSDYYGG